MRCAGCENEVPPKAPGSPGRPRKWCSENCRKRAHENEIVGACKDCGRGMPRRWVYDERQRCRECYLASSERRMEARAQIIADMWQDGLLIREIADAMGWEMSHMQVEFDRIRRRYPDLLPYRYRLSAPKTEAQVAA